MLIKNKNKAKAQHIQVAKVWYQTDGTLCVGTALSHLHYIARMLPMLAKGGG